MPRTPTLADGPRDMTVKAVPAALYNALARLAKGNHRPLRGEVLAALEYYVAVCEASDDEATQRRGRGRPKRVEGELS